MIAATYHGPTNGDTLIKQSSRLRTAAKRATAQVAAGLQGFYGNRCSDGFGILMYHRVAEHVPGVTRPTWNVTPTQLRNQLTGLLSRGFESWSLTRLLKAHHESRTVPSNAFAVTFDDGYENNYLNAWPILRDLNISATIFLTTKYLGLDQPFPFDDWPASGSAGVPPASWRPLSTKQCDELLASGLIELGAHTHSHERFLNRRDEFLRDMRSCLDLMRDRFAIVRPAFALPYGDGSTELVEAAKELGVACCLTVRDRRVQPDEDPFSWGRLTVDAGDTPAILAAKLSGWHAATVTALKQLARPLVQIKRPARTQEILRPLGSSI